MEFIKNEWFKVGALLVGVAFLVFLYSHFGIRGTSRGSTSQISQSPKASNDLGRQLTPPPQNRISTHPSNPAILIRQKNFLMPTLLTGRLLIQALLMEGHLVLNTPKR